MGAACIKSTKHFVNFLPDMPTIGINQLCSIMEVLFLNLHIGVICI